MITGRLNGRYELGEALGYGGMSEVRAARDTLLNRDVAIKILRKDLARDHNFLERFRREARNSARLNHPNIVAIYDTGECVTDDGTLAYIVMERLGGRTLRELVGTEGALPIKQALRLIAQVANALDYSHQMGIVHRDIKPANIMLTLTGTPKVMDFGISRAADDMQSLTQTATVFGTAQYISPEHAMGHKIDYRADIYALGCVLYECLTGQPPFQAETAVAVACKHVQDAPIPPSNIRPEISPELDAVVLKALAKRPEDRFANAGDFQGALENILGEKVATRVQLPDYQKMGATLAADTAPTESFATATSILPIQVRPLDELDSDKEEGDGDGSLAGLAAPGGPADPYYAPATAQLGAAGAGAAGAAAWAAAQGGYADTNNNGPYNNGYQGAFPEQGGYPPSAGPAQGQNGAGYPGYGPAGAGGWGGAGTASVASFDDGNGQRPNGAPADSRSDADEHSDGKSGGKKRGRAALIAVASVLGLLLAGTGVYYGVVTNPNVNMAAYSDLQDYQGRDARPIYDSLVKDGYTVNVVTNYMRTQTNGTIIRTNPPAGSKVNKETPITIYVATGGEPIEVPDVAGKSVDEARATLLLMGIPVESATKVRPSERSKKGDVIGTSTPAGENIPPNKSIQIYVGSGRPAVRMPSVIGDEENVAKEKVAKAKLKVRVQMTKSSKPRGTVVSLKNAGQDLSEGDTVTLVVSDGSLIVMPDLVGETVGSARSMLAEAGWDGQLNRSRASTLNIARIGRVAKQYPAAGAEVDKDSAVSITVYELNLP